MKKRRIILFFVCFIFIFFMLFLNSSFFYLNSVEVSLYEKSSNLKYKKINNNLYSCNINSVNKDLGKSVFKINKDNYINSFEIDNPNLKVLKIDLKFPNKLVFNVVKRQEVFVIKSQNEIFSLDEDFKIIKKSNEFSLEPPNLIEIGGETQNYFDFFQLSSSCYFEGYFLNKNNILIEKIKNFKSILQQVNLETNIINKLSFKEVSTQCNLICLTNPPFGVKILIENIEENFDKKFLKVLNALLTLVNTDKIKTTYGVLKINNSLNCSFFEK